MIFPDVVPFRLTLWDASSSAVSQICLLTGAIVVTPMILAYSAFAYRVFRGKTPRKAGNDESTLSTSDLVCCHLSHVDRRHRNCDSCDPDRAASHHVVPT